jgi:hypothetical protein
MPFGFQRVRCPTLEHGSFDVAAPGQVRVLADEEAECCELLLEEDGDPAAIREAELAALALHYQRAARGGHAIVSHTA